MPLSVRTTSGIAGAALLLGLLWVWLHDGSPLAEIIPMDSHSHARPNEVRVKHVSLDLALDFEKHQVHGRAHLRFERIVPTADLILDTNNLEIENVVGADGGAREFRLGPPDPILGRALVVPLHSNDGAVTIDYRTHPDAAALQWLAPDQTSGKLPFLYTQGQAILTRSWIPLQDTPGVRVTYDATVRAPVTMQVVMSAPERERRDDNSFRFEMKQRIPSYLIALACGDIDSREISDRCAVYAEPAVVERAALELADMARMLAACEQAFGAYRWGRYDVIILPPAFPLGGMENPTLTFATPTILAGDKSLVSIIAHELSHSWSGNLVSNATWRDFWLNEGFTVYLEHRIMEIVYGKERADMEILLGLNDLEEELKQLPPRDQVLYVDLAGRDPDDGMTSVPYQKGAAFLRRLEELFGRERFDGFLQSYFAGHAFQSITTDRFLAYLQENLLAAAPDQARQLDVELWVRGEGLPADLPRPESGALRAAETAVQAWFSGTYKDEMAAGFVTHQWLRFINHLPADVTAVQMDMLDTEFQFTNSGNSEILAAWLRRAVRCGYFTVSARLEEFLMNVGRRKYLEPLYKELVASDDGLAMARHIYERARPRYHAMAVSRLDEILRPKLGQDYVMPVAMLRERIATRGVDAIHDQTGRMFHADAESLAAGGCDRFLREVEGLLHKEGVRLRAVEEKLTASSYSLAVNGVTHLMYAQQDIESEATRPGITWGLTAARCFALINDLLRAAGSPEQIFAVGSGNDLQGVFLTAELVKQLQARGDAVATELPYQMTEKYPTFGQRQ
ncbi:MAG: M1 family metallopeptidase [Planctomycetota bacterium]